MLFNAADYLILTLVGFSALFGLWRGFAKEVFSLLSWFLACIFSRFFYEDFAAMLPLSASTEPWMASSIAVVIIFGGTLLAGSLLSKVFNGFVKMTGMSGKDKVLGFVFGVARGGVVVMLILVVVPQIFSVIAASAVPMSERGWWQESFFIPKFLGFEEQAVQLFDGLSKTTSSLVERAQ